MQTLRLPAGLAWLRALGMPRVLGILERIYGRALAAHGTAWVITAGGVCWKLDLNDATQRWIVYGDYEGSRQMRWLRRWLAGGGTVVDSGASFGQMLLYLAPLPGVRVVAFEPVPDSAAWLRECLALQRGWCVDVVEAALAQEAGSLWLQSAGPHSTAQMHWYPDADNPRVQVRAMRLDQYPDLGPVRLWKLDVEGSELPALAGAQALLDQARIDAVLVEVSDATRDAVDERLTGAGYRAFTIGRGARLRPQPRDTGSGTRNRLYLSPRTVAGPA